MRLTALALSVTLFACGSSGGGVDDPHGCGDKPLYGVSKVNVWPGLDPVLYAQEVAAACQGLVEIEGLPWFPQDGLCDAAHPGGCTQSYREERKALLKAMSTHKITVYIPTQNSNAAGPWYFTEETFREYVRGIRQDVEELGIEDGVWVGTPTEPWAHDFVSGFRRAQIVREEWPWTLVIPDAGANRPTGRAYFSSLKYDYLEVHPCSLTDTEKSISAGKPILTVTDCSPVLNPGSAANLSLFSLAHDLKQPLVIYDAF